MCNMKEFIEKLIGRLEETRWTTIFDTSCIFENDKLDKCIQIVNQLTEEYKELFGKTEQLNNGWIPCSERLPEVETKVLIHAKRKYMDGSFRDIITTAMYEDGTMLEDDSKWHWEDIEGEWDEENDCYIIPEGWWEDKMYNADGELNHAVDDEVIEWQPLPEPYQPEGE